MKEMKSFTRRIKEIDAEIAVHQKRIDFLVKVRNVIQGMKTLQEAKS